ncbi:hypothetical protein T4A_7234 [Trichinella pseudospiralis]|uniref:Uncharacterized protein n=1 Tax=Trichinella pseudospiralis TaxID=6337 RepID=A0A0V1E8J1_TRIPS|nr:hypothetical protein T4A_7234 [Trichinella pseudospiralis]
MRNEELKDNSDVAWSNALKFAQMNSVRHRVLNRLLYQALYGCNLMQNACKDHIPSEILRQADGEEELGNNGLKLKEQADKMVQDSIKNWRWPLGGGEIGAVLVVNLNRARADQRNLLRMLLSKDDHGIVIIVMEPTDVLAEESISIQTASTKESRHRGQGYSEM